MKRLIFVFVLFLCLCGCSSDTSEKVEIKKVTCDQKDEMLKDDKKVMLVDVRTEEEFNSKHLADAVNIPYDTIVDKLATYGTIDFKTPIIVYCKSGGRSNMAANALLDAGYKKIYDLGAISNCDK